jgi:myosin heavy subunit
VNHHNIKRIALPPCFPCPLQVLHHYPFTFITFQHIIHSCYLQEYTSENIDWTRVDFEDNQECLDLIEKRPLGVISLMDEECTFPRATDVTLANKLKEHLRGNACFKGERSKAFRICHYAGEVMYETSGFLEKNRDLLHADLLQLLASCDSFLPQLFAASIGEGSQKVPTPTRRVNGTESQKQSVAAKFKVFFSYIFSVHCLSCFLPKDQSGRGQESC